MTSKQAYVKQLAIELHKPIRRTFDRNKMHSSFPFEKFSIDLIVTGIHAQGDYKYILVCIDNYSRYGWCVPMKTKDAKAAWEAFWTIISKKKPQNVDCDAGTEFRGYFEKKLKELGISKFSTYSETGVQR